MTNALEMDEQFLAITTKIDPAINNKIDLAIDNKIFPNLNSKLNVCKIIII